MNLHHLTDRHLRRVRVVALHLELDESFADPPEREAKLRGRPSVIQIGRAVLKYERAYDRYVTTAPGTPTEDQAERMALHAVNRMVEGAEVAIMLGDPFRVASDQPLIQGRWDLAMLALFDGLIAVARGEPDSDESLDACHILAGMLGG